jgi:hypothetical protein
LAQKGRYESNSAVLVVVIDREGRSSGGHQRVNDLALPHALYELRAVALYGLSKLRRFCLCSIAFLVLATTLASALLRCAAISMPRGTRSAELRSGREIQGALAFRRGCQLVSEHLPSSVSLTSMPAKPLCGGKGRIHVASYGAYLFPL